MDKLVYKMKFYEKLGSTNKEYTFCFLIRKLTKATTKNQLKNR